MSVFTHPRFLSYVMWADAASCVGCGALQLVFTDHMAGVTGLGAPLLAATGWFLIAYAVAAAFIASRRQPPRGPIAVVVLGNVAWAAACAGLALSGVFALSAFGWAWLGLQAGTVLVLAELQWTGLRQGRAGSMAKA